MKEPKARRRAASVASVPVIVASAISIPTASADIAFETELNGTATNNSIALAQLLDNALFTPNANPNVFGALPTATIYGKGGANDVDFYCFSTAFAGAAYFDIDGAGFDTYLALFDSTGTLLADSDDSFPPDPGSATHLDAILGTYMLASAGTYYLAVSRSGNFANATFTGGSFAELYRPDGAFGGFSFAAATYGNSSFLLNGSQLGLDYTLHLSVVPAPAALAAIGLSSLLVRRRRRRADAL